MATSTKNQLKMSTNRHRPPDPMLSDGLLPSSSWHHHDDRQQSRNLPPLTNVDCSTTRCQINKSARMKAAKYSSLLPHSCIIPTVISLKNDSTISSLSRMMTRTKDYHDHGRNTQQSSRRFQSSSKVMWLWSILILLIVMHSCPMMMIMPNVNGVLISSNNHQSVTPAGCEWRPLRSSSSSHQQPSTSATGTGHSGSHSSMDDSSSSLSHLSIQAHSHSSTHSLSATTTMGTSSSSSSSSSLSSSSSTSSSANQLLQCHFRTLNGALDSGVNLSLIPGDRTHALRLQCEDLLFQSQLPERAFRSLHQLRELYIERCKLSELPAHVFIGLQELRHLTIRTYNTDWGDLSLRLSTSTSSIFSPIKNLESLDLSENGLSQLPSSILCPLNRLQYVNISANSFQDVASLGFSAKSSYEASTTSSSSSLSSSSSSASAQTATGSMKNDCRRLDSILNLDASHNRIKVLTDRGFSRLHYLQVLNLRQNLIARAEETSLAGLAELNRLDLSNNQLVALPARFFQAVKTTLAELYLQNNSISVIPPGLFSGLSQVTVLDLSNNEVTSHWIGPTTFADMSRLLSLDLSHNKLSRVDATVFRALYTLQSLSLKNNIIESLAENAFISNRNLHTLSLSGNRLQTLDAASFTGLEVLNALFLDDNRLQIVHVSSFANITSLMELNVGQNRLQTVPQAIQTLHSLRSLDLSHNQIGDISNASYRGLEQLYSLNLEDNIIGNLSRGDFLDLPSLRVLNLANNSIGSVEQGTFDNIPDLHALRLDSNKVADINGLFVNLRDLLMLNISANRIQMFDYAMIPVGLQWLDLHDNLIENLGNYFEIESELKLRTLDASHNRLVEIDSKLIPDSIELVMLNRNQIRKIAAFTFLKKDNLTRADLSDNRLATLDLNALRLSKPPPTRRPSPEFMIAGNPFVCDCNIEWLQRAALLSTPTLMLAAMPPPSTLSPSFPSLIGSDPSRQLPRVVDAHQIQCRLAFGRGQQPMMTTLAAARQSQFLCSYRSHCFALCHCCEFDACDCEMTCPDNCTCFYDQSWNTNIVDCGRNGHYLVPTRIPMDVTDLYLDGNNIAELSPHTFIGRKNLRHLYLNASHIHTINNRTFNGLKSLLVLNLADNQLDTLYGYEFERLTDLRELYLENNIISTIANRTFSALRSLQTLRLDNNRIVEFELWSMLASSLPSLQQLYLGDNAWSCDCQFVGQMMEWLPARQDIIRDLARVHCQYNESYALPLGAVAAATTMTNLYKLTEIEQARANISAACSLYAKRESIAASSSSSSSVGINGGVSVNGMTGNGTGNQIEMFIPILALIVFSTFGVLLLLASIVTAVLYRHEISVWFYARTGIRLGGGSSTGSGAKGGHGRRGRHGRGGRHGRHSDPYDADCGEKLFDAFVSYSKKDEQFVQQMLAPELEYGTSPMRLCLHYRDLPVASGFVADAIIEAMAASRRTILVISEHFLRGEWQHFEFKTAHQEALRSRARHKLILIFVGPVAGKDLDPDIRVWLKTAGNTCLQWGEKMFWEKLRYAMPEIPTASSGGGSSVNSSSSSTTSSLYGRKALQLSNNQQSKNSTLPLSLSSNQQMLNCGTNNRNFDSYQHHHQLHHPLLGGAQTTTTTLGRQQLSYGHSPMMDHPPSMAIGGHPLYSPSSIHSQQSTYAYPTYHPTGVPPPNVAPPPLPPNQLNGPPQSTPPPLPPSHPLHQRLFHNHSNGSVSGVSTSVTTMESSSGSGASGSGPLSTHQQQQLPATSTMSNIGHHFHQGSSSSTSGRHHGHHLNHPHHQQQQSASQNSNDSSLMLTSNGSDISGQSTMPFVPSASSTTAVAVHI